MYKPFWDNIWRNIDVPYYVSRIPTTELPWETYTYDKHLEQALNMLNPIGCRILEVGCGSGYDAKFLSQKGHFVTAMDISDEAIKIAKENNTNNNINYKTADIVADSIDGVFDIVYDRGCLHNLNKENGDWNLVFSKLHKILVKNGKIILITGNTNQPAVSYTTPTPASLSDVEIQSKPFFKIILAKEIPYVTNRDYYDSIGWLFILEKIS
jgi:SAM-dependent methyltransferase